MGAENRILPHIDHVVVLMMENRSLDNLLGWVYSNGSPAQVLPVGSSPEFDGCSTGLSNTDPTVNGGHAVHVSNGTVSSTNSKDGTTISEWYVPSPDPGEEYDHVMTQISSKMSGFLTDYVTQAQPAGTPPEQIMEMYSPEQLPIISKLATSFALSDAWFSSVPSQTWPNRGFVQAGSSAGHVNNEPYLPWHITTVFDVLGENKVPWMVYNDGLLPSATKIMFLDKYWDNETNFGKIEDFENACKSNDDGALPAFSFVEPNFGLFGHDESYHPPHDVRPGEQFLERIYNAVRQSPKRDQILFIFLFDEHGGTYDHVEPPCGAARPEPGAVASNGFQFNKFGVRVPAIIVSSWVAPGTVFRSNQAVPLDHTSVLATLRDWLGLSAAFADRLPSPRIAAAPNLAYVLTEANAHPWPELPKPPVDLTEIPEPDDSQPLNGVQQSVLIGAAEIAARRALRPTARQSLDPTQVQTTRARLKTHGDARTFLKALEGMLPIR